MVSSRKNFDFKFISIQIYILISLALGSMNKLNLGDTQKKLNRHPGIIAGQ